MKFPFSVYITAAIFSAIGAAGGTLAVDYFRHPIAAAVQPRSEVPSPSRFVKNEPAPAARATIEARPTAPTLTIGPNVVIAAPADWQDMALIDLVRDPIPGSLQAIWGDLIQASNEKFKADFGQIKAANGNAPSTIRWKQFNVGDTVVIASIFHGVAANCNTGADSTSTDQTYAQCPTRVTVMKNGKATSQQTMACFNGFPLGPNEPAPADEKTLAAFDEATKRLSFRAMARGKVIKTCERTVDLSL